MPVELATFRTGRGAPCDRVLQCGSMASGDAVTNGTEVPLVSLEIGDEVVVRPLGRKRGSIIAKGRNGRYQVRVEGVTAWCREENLAIPPRPTKKQLAREKELARANDPTPS